MSQKLLLISLSFFLLQSSIHAQQTDLPSSVYAFDMLPSEISPGGSKKTYLDWRTTFFDRFQVYLRTMNTDLPTVDGDMDTKAETLIIVKQGKLGIAGTGFSEVFEERSVVLVPPGKEVGFFTPDKSEASYFVIQWIPKKGGVKAAPHTQQIEAFSYDGMEFKPTQKGGRRSIRQAPSAGLQELEMHITTLNEGEKSHDPHTHVDEEIILVLEGEVEESINGTPYRLGAGSLIFLASMDPHGIRNVGRGRCEYYAIRFTPLPKQ